MAIRIEHGGRGSDTAGQIIAQAGQGEANRQQRTLESLLRLAEGAGRPVPAGPGGGGGGGGGGGLSYDDRALKIRELNAARNMQRERISAQAKRDTAAADQATAKTALQFGLDEQIREQEFDNELKQKKEEARLAANQWELHYSPKQLQEVSRRNHSNQTIASQLQRGEISQEEAAAMTKGNNDFIDNIQPGRRPADPNKPKFEEGKPPNSTYLTKNGSEMQVLLDGSTKMIARPDQNQEFITKQAEIVRQQTLEDNEISARADTNAAILKNLQETPIDVPDLEAGLDEDGKIQMTTRLRRPAEWMQEYLTLTGQQPIGQPQQIPQPQAPQAPQAPQEQLPVVDTEEQYDALEPGEAFIDSNGKQGTRHGQPQPRRQFGTEAGNIDAYLGGAF